MTPDPLLPDARRRLSPVLHARPLKLTYVPMTLDPTST